MFGEPISYGHHGNRGLESRECLSVGLWSLMKLSQCHENLRYSGMGIFCLVALALSNGRSSFT